LADDLLQESYLRFLRTGITGLNEFQMKAYLYKTALSVAQDHWRTVQRDRFRQLEVLPKAAPSRDPNLPHDIHRLFKKLDPRQQTLLWLAYVEGFHHREIAELLNLKEKSVRVLLSRSRKQFGEILTQEGLKPKESS
jgi:RNA polymerase sigma factor (sigma-70 family)